jgi:nucleoside-diphosphate-sugar epimerase
MKYLVTGGAGFIGSHIVERLLKEGHFVRVLDNFSSGKKENLSFTANSELRTPNFELIQGDIRDKTTCNRACDGIDYVLHQAALRSVPKSMKDPQSYNDVNINGTLYMLQAAAKNKVKRFVFASSSSVYGDTAQFPEREDAYPLLISPYALSKLAGEYYCRIFSEHFNLETVCLRYFNVFGPRQALDDEYAVVIPKFIHCILHGQQPPIFGTGKQSRDFTYIDNVVEANILAATKGLGPQDKTGTDPVKAIKGMTRDLSPQHGTVPDVKVLHEVFNVANGKDNTVLGLVDSLNKIIGKDIKPAFLPIRAGDVFRTLADISKIKKILGFEPKIGFEEGLRRTVAGFKGKQRCAVETGGNPEDA